MKKPLYDHYKLGTRPKPRTLRETLERIREVLTPENNWIKEAATEEAENLPYDAPDDDLKNAGKVCLIGAIFLIDGEKEAQAEKAIIGAINDLYEHTRPWMAGYQPEAFENIPCFNDDEDVTHRDVLRVLDHAIAKVSKKKAKK